MKEAAVVRRYHSLSPAILLSATDPKTLLLLRSRDGPAKWFTCDETPTMVLDVAVLQDVP